MNGHRNPGAGPSSFRSAAWALAWSVAPVAVGALIGFLVRIRVDDVPVIAVGVAVFFGWPILFLPLTRVETLHPRLLDWVALVLMPAAGGVFAGLTLIEGWEPWAPQLTVTAGVLVSTCWRIALTGRDVAPAPSRGSHPTGAQHTPRPLVGRWLLLAASVVVLAPGVLATAFHLPVGPGLAPTVTTATGPQRVALPWQELQYPDGVTFSADGRIAYISGTDVTTDEAGTTYEPYLTAIDTHTDTAITTTSTAARVASAGLSPDGHRLYLPVRGTDENPGAAVAVVDTTTLDVLTTVAVGQRPFDVALSADGSRAYVTNRGGGTSPGATLGSTVSVIDTATNTLLGDFDVQPGPYRLGISPDGRLVYVANRSSSISPDGTTYFAGNTLTIIDATDNSTRVVPVGDQSPVSALPSPDGRLVYIVCAGTTTAPGSVRVLDTTSGLITPLGATAVHNAPEAALSPDGHTLVVPQTGTNDVPGDTVSIIDTATGAARSVPLEGRPERVTITPNGQEAWVTTDDGNLWRIALTP